MKNSDMPAMPMVNSDGFPSTAECVLEDRIGTRCDGLTKREHFAGLALQGTLSNPNLRTGVSLEKIVKHSVAVADALLQELEK